MLKRPPAWRRAARAVRLRWRFVAGVFLLVTAGTWVSLQLVTEEYEAETSLAVLSEAGIGAGSQGEGRHRRAREVHVLRSRRLIEQVVDQLGPERFRFGQTPPNGPVKRVAYALRRAVSAVREALVFLGIASGLSERERAILLVERSLSLVSEEPPETVTLRVRLQDPRTCVETLEALIQALLGMQVEVRRNPNAAAPLASRVEGLAAELETLDAARQELFQARSVADVEQERSLLLDRLSRTQSRLDMNRSEREKLWKQREQMASRLDSLPERLRGNEVVIRNPSREAMERRIAELKLRRQELLSRFRPEAPPVVNVQEEIAGLEALLEREEPTRFESATMEIHPVRREFSEQIPETDAQLAGLDAEGLELVRQTEELERRLSDLHRSRVQLENLERERETTERSYFAYSDRRRNAEMWGELAELRVPAVAVLSPPSVSTRPVYPNKLLVLATALPVGILLGLVLAVARESSDERVEAEWSLLDLGDFDYLGAYTLPAAALSPNSPEE